MGETFMTVHISENVYKFIEEISERAQADNQKWGKIFKECFLDTLEKTARVNEDGTTFVLTGDIPAMWLRECTTQYIHYLMLADFDESIRELISGLVELQFQYIIHDPYANAFNQTANGNGHQSDHTELTPLIWERKYEIDSLAYPLQLAYLLYKNTGKTEHFNATFMEALEAIVGVWEQEQDHSQSPYTFVRDTDRLEDTLDNDGRGSDTAYTGMTWCGFRPSDDRCQYHYLVPSNMFAVVVLDYMLDLKDTIDVPEDLARRMEKLRDEIDQGIQEHGVVQNKAGKDIYAYEADGLGNYSIMDDPNVPSLLAAPYLGYCELDDELYI